MMPFDFTPIKPTPFDFRPINPSALTTPADRVRHALGEKGERWIKGESLNPRGGRCLGQAIGDFGDRALNVAVRRVINRRGFPNIPAFNDARETTFANVLAVLAEARANARAAASPPRRGLWRIFCS
jgi:hypothetical protein